MLTSPFMILPLAICFLLTLMVYTLSISQLCLDKIDGLVSSQASTGALLEQRDRASRTARRSFLLALALSALALMLLRMNVY